MVNYNKLRKQMIERERAEYQMARIRAPEGVKECCRNCKHCVEIRSHKRLPWNPDIAICGWRKFDPEPQVANARRCENYCYDKGEKPIKYPWG